MGKNNKGLYYKYRTLEEVFHHLGPDRCREGLTAQEVYDKWREMHPGERYGETDALGLKTVSAMLNHYREGSPKATRGTPALFVRLGKNRFTLRKFILNDASRGHTDSAEISNEGDLIVAAHLKRERSDAAQKFKDGLTNLQCEACTFDFESFYGQLGRGFIEAHHELPLRYGPRKTNASTDFRAVCSNCHSMLHRCGLKTVNSLKGIIEVHRIRRG